MRYVSDGILPCHFSPNANSPDCSQNYLVKLIARDRPVNSNSFHSMGREVKVQCERESEKRDSVRDRLTLVKLWALRALCQHAQSVRADAVFMGQKGKIGGGEGG